MMFILVLIIVVGIIVFMLAKRRPQESVAINLDRNSTTYQGYFKTDLLTRKAFVMYVIMVFSKLDEKCCENIIDANGDIRPQTKEIIEKAFHIVTTGEYNSYSQKGNFNLYRGQNLSPENKVFMDMFEELIYGSNNANVNRAEQLSDDNRTQLLLSMHSIHNMLISNDADLMKGKRELAQAYDEVFNN